ncbi:hypothetical protein RhiirA4_489105 [Rhizophagus irregularis]|uniref:RNase H type-1 domain-containing protein n=1 Tax=Rhizophagus irregularis TaxID=588596 RepID=A0A2I1HUG6_9GLOM|nr:hypothetical protein RhiirA4_489105 [Rhizophagus irregularis]
MTHQTRFHGNKFVTLIRDKQETNTKPSNSERETEIDRKALINMQAFKMTKKMPSKDSRKKKQGSVQYNIGSGIVTTRVRIASYRDYLDLACINRISSCQDNLDTKIIKDIIETRDYPGRQRISEQIPDLIQIYDYDTALIRNTVSNEEAMMQHITLLHQLRSVFNPSDTIDIYTDGSLTNCFNTNLNDFTKHMGTGWVIINDKNEVIMECSSSITEWPSSICAELGAILLVILVLQIGQRANIFTDSQAAIDSINHIRINLTNGKNKI